ncbi:expressed unknown protein [Seminavis robusta]|uniref:BTB domain-containing protein n=1 Tax=Seminavis robusta TaxID=568900 RepID=A0A9N8ET79_9STRA|nr:expressed unknown protein [Seminavis robusta]|eukprot:Sro1753_g295400.1 n/a (275) ;mRNA; r:5173-5997
MEASKDDNDNEVSIREMLRSFLTDDALNDVTLKGIDGVEVPANRFLLAARSKVFRGMLLGKFQEASSPVVELGFKGIVLKSVVEYILTDSVQSLNCKKRKSQDGSSFDFQMIQSLVAVAEAASYFQLPGLGRSTMKACRQILVFSPCSSFAVLQACKMAGPVIPASMAEQAMKKICSVPAQSISKEHVRCLSADVLEEILQNPKTEMTEYHLFQILQVWAEGNGDDNNNNQTKAKALSKHICLQKINPETLSTTIAASGLVTSEQLLEAYKSRP